MITIAVVGRPNVGKSTLFNALAKRNISITHKSPGITRDVNSINITHKGLDVRLFDTGGISQDGIFSDDIAAASFDTMHHADIVFFIVSVEEITAEDEMIANMLRKSHASVLLVVNKVDNEKRTWELGDFYRFGFKHMVSISALHRKNLDNLWDFCISVSQCEHQDESHMEDVSCDNEITDIVTKDFDVSNNIIRFMLLGKPNTGKSSVMNYIAGKNRSLISDMPGTTRDLVEEHIQNRGKQYCLVDSAGIRRKTKIHDDVEYYSSHRAISGIMSTDVVVLLIDVQDDFSEQDKKLAMLVLNRGKGLVIGLNKWDLVEVKENRLQAERDRIRFLAPQLHFVPIIPMSAHSGYGIDKIFDTVNHVYTQLHTRIVTSLLNRDMEKWVLNTPPPLVRGKRGKVKFVAQLQGDSIIFEVHVNSPKLFSSTYAQYLINCIRRQYSLTHVPMKLTFVNKNS